VGRYNVFVSRFNGLRTPLIIKPLKLLSRALGRTTGLKTGIYESDFRLQNQRNGLYSRLRSEF